MTREPYSANNQVHCLHCLAHSVWSHALTHSHDKPKLMSEQQLVGQTLVHNTIPFLSGSCFAELAKHKDPAGSRMCVCTFAGVIALSVQAAVRTPMSLSFLLPSTTDVETFTDTFHHISIISSYFLLGLRGKWLTCIRSVKDILAQLPPSFHHIFVCALLMFYTLVEVWHVDTQWHIHWKSIYFITDYFVAHRNHSFSVCII